MVLMQTSVSGIDFLTNVYYRSWLQALQAIDQTGLYETLRLLDQIDRQDLQELTAIASAMSQALKADRLKYCSEVVTRRQLPSTTPSAVLGTTDGAAFLAKASPLLLTQDPTWTLPPALASQRSLSEADFGAAAALLGVETATIKAVATVEASGAPFANDGRCIVRFELHKFAKYTNNRFSSSHPHLSSTYTTGRDRAYHSGQGQEWSHLYGAAVLRCTEFAILSTSWGMFQIMGFNHAASGYATAGAFASAMCTSAGDQLKAFVHLCKHNGWSKYLARKDWAGFASHFNGPAYHGYDARLAKAYQRFSGTP